MTSEERRTARRATTVGALLLVVIGWTTALEAATTWVLDQLRVTKGGQTYTLQKNASGQWVIPKWPDVPAANPLTYTFIWKVQAGGYPGDAQVMCCSHVRLGGQDLGYGGVQTESPYKVKKTISFNYSTIPFPTTVEFRVTPDQTFSVTQLVQGAPPSPSYQLSQAFHLSVFGLLMSPTFGHARCTNCHGMATSNATFTQHKNSYNIGTVADAQNASKCTSCHGQFAGWRAPSTSFSWTGKTAKETSNLVKQKRSGATLVSHLKNDNLIQWSINSGTVPGGTKPKAPPGSLATWNQRVDQWTSHGQPCGQ
ncbi:MAG: hypothetical protein ACREJ4_06900 [Candidatus Methylomirabilaceae bacterium]